MTLYLTASTPVRKVFIDFIEVLLCDGRVVSLNWDESGIDWTEDGFSARYKGICFDEEYANGKMEQLQGLKVTAVLCRGRGRIPCRNANLFRERM